jgi:hypothetical protein
VGDRSYRGAITGKGIHRPATADHYVSPRGVTVPPAVAKGRGGRVLNTVRREGPKDAAIAARVHSREAAAVHGRAKAAAAGGGVAGLSDEVATRGARQQAGRAAASRRGRRSSLLQWRAARQQPHKAAASDQDAGDQDAGDRVLRAEIQPINGSRVPAPAPRLVSIVHVQSHGKPAGVVGGAGPPVLISPGDSANDSESSGATVSSGDGGPRSAGSWQCKWTLVRTGRFV